MAVRSGFLTGVLIGVLSCGLAAGAYWATRREAGAKKVESRPAPATVPHPLKEDAINTVTLTQEAVDRLALKTGNAEKKRIRRSRTYFGEVMIPPGQALVMSAPLNGVINAVAGAAPKVGAAVAAGQSILQLTPLLTPEARANLATANVDAGEQVKRAQTEVESTRIALERAKRVFQSEAGSRRLVDEAQAQHDLARRGLEAANARHEQMQTIAKDLERGAAGPIAIKSPQAGMLRSISVLPGQNVPAGAVLFEVVDLDQLWVRVPVYVGDLREIDQKAAPTLGGLDSPKPPLSASLRLVDAPPTANAIAGTADLYFAFDNKTIKLRPGERVSVRVGLNSEEESLVVPWSAVVYDIHGGTWLYEADASHTFRRRRVTVQFVNGADAVLSAGPPSGTRVVTLGAAELFGAETGFTK